jgi:drug/metabolite transporter (DMT)-like permease
MGIVWLAERPTRFQWLGIGLATLGAFIYFYPVALPTSQLFGVLAAVCGVLANAGASILGREVNRTGDIHPLVVTVISMGIGSIALLAAGISIQGLPNISTRSWAIIAWLAVVNTAFAFTLWNHTLRTLSATESSIINGTMLIWIPVLAVVFLHERVTAKEVFGLGVVVAGTLIVQLRHPRIVTRLLRRRSV